MKKVLLTLVAISSVFMITGCGNTKKHPASRIDEEKIKTNVNENVIREIVVEGMKIERASLVYEGGESVLTTAVTNVSNSPIVVDSIDCIYSDAEGNQTILPLIIGELAQGQTVYITSRTDVDLTKAISVDYQVRK